MLVRTKLIGSGKRGDEYRPLLPTFTEVLTLVDQGVGYFLIPNTDHPNLLEHPSAKSESTGHGAALIALDDAGHNAWYDHLDKRYKEHKGEFRPEIA